MKIVVIGGSGLIGKQVVSGLRERGHEVMAASPSTGVNALTGEGLEAAIAGAAVVVDVSNSPSFEDRAVLEFFETSTRNLLAAETAADVGHHVALSVVGADLLADSGYMRAKVAQEQLIESATVPYTIVRATQFYEFLGGIADSATTDGEVRLPAAKMQPMAASDVAAAVVEVALSAPANGVIEIAGPESLPMHEAVGRCLAARGDSRRVLADPSARYFGTPLHDSELAPISAAHLGSTRLEAWLAG
jgi:uncharacterized protein YbjT (DUF2867 family)